MPSSFQNWVYYTEEWTGFDITKDSYKYLKGSYKRTMKIVGAGLNECREGLGQEPVPMEFE